MQRIDMRLGARTATVTDIPQFIVTLAPRLPVAGLPGARTESYAEISANAAANAVAALLDGGFLRIYDGAKPANADIAVSTQTVLAELEFNDPAFLPAAGGVATANPMMEDASANATGTASWFRAFRANGTAVCDGTVGLADADLNLSSTTVVTGMAVEISSFTITQVK